MNRGVKRSEQLQTRPGEEEAQIGNPKLGSILSPVQQDYSNDDLRIPVYDDRGVDADESDDSREDDDGFLIECAYNMKQEELHGGVFLKKYIPAKDSFLALHDHLSALWDHRQTIASAMNLALEDDDVSHYGIY